MFDTVHQDEVEKQQQKLKDLSDERWEQIVREYAYTIWEEAGRPDGRADEFWHQARREMCGALKMAKLQLAVLYWKYKYEGLVAQIDFDAKMVAVEETLKKAEAHGAEAGTPRSDDGSLGDELHREGNEVGRGTLDTAG